jgi:carbon storage regulator
MLVLGRRVGEEIVLPQLGIKIAVTRIQHDRVSIGIEAPKDITILRKELLDREAQAVVSIPEPKEYDPSNDL